VLAVGAVLGGAINLPVIHWLTDWLRPVLNEEPGTFNWAIAILATAGAVGMGYLGWWIYTRNAQRVLPNGQDPAYHYTGDIWDGMESAWYLDGFYNAAVVRPFRALGRFLAQVFDPQGIDGLATGVGRLFGTLGAGVRGLQSGFVRTYALIFTVGVILVLSVMLFVTR